MLADDLAALLLPLGAAPRKMFGGTCFMRNGNLLIGTHKGGLIVRVGPAGEAQARAMGADAMEMGGRAMKGWVLVDEGAAQEHGLPAWIALALAFNATLPPEAAKRKRKG